MNHKKLLLFSLLLTASNSYPIFKIADKDVVKVLSKEELTKQALEKLSELSECQKALNLQQALCLKYLTSLAIGMAVWKGSEAILEWTPSLPTVQTLREKSAVVKSSIEKVQKFKKTIAFCASIAAARWMFQSMK